MKIICFLTSFACISLLTNNLAYSQSDLKTLAKEIHQQAFTVDSHNDTPMRFGDTSYNMAESHDARKNGGKMDFPRMKQGGLDGAFFAVFVGQGPLTDEGRNSAYSRAKATYDHIYKTASKHADLAGIALTPKDGYKLEDEGKISMFIGLENGYPIGRDITRIEEFYHLGTRYITLCHSKNNDICDSSTDPAGPLHNGLSSFGAEVVHEMNRLGIMVDVSHMSDKSFYDVIQTSSAPVIASHSCAKALCNNPRNLNDDMIKALAKNGGVIQMCILSAYVKSPEQNPERNAAETAIRQKYGDWSNLTQEQLTAARAERNALRQKYPERLATVKDMVDHIDHIVALAGIDHVGIGTDFDGGGGLADCYDASEMGNITLELVTRGYSKKDIEKIWSGNIFRVMNEVGRVAKKEKN
ncbi:MAG: membrane dipeptidase [Bacteroidetes bacterium GWF2_49_14]|nr:MAG: membrane dipeptidase [Bacteroidetes bacterium GWF2_49_14]HBB92733.1 membrane dipeptidase [Bacteroidales bacterium]